MKKKKAVTTQTSTRKKSPKKKVVRDKTSKCSPWLEDYMDLFTFKLKPVTMSFIERLSQEFLHWALTDDDAIKISQFFVKKRIPSKTFYSWIKKYEPMKDAHAIAKQAIGDRREHGALTKKYDASVVTKMMPHYDNDWREIEEWRAEMRTKEEDANIQRVVVLEKMPNSDMVPKKKNDD